MSLQIEQIKRKRKNSTPLIFNLDLHISVIADLKSGLKSHDANLVNWSISGANRHNRRVFKVQDPVRVINGKSWTSLDDKLIEEFVFHYKSFLSQFDGFITCYPPSFAALFENFKKPSLVMSATRYEAPYTSRPSSWHDLNRYLVSEHNSGRMILAGNNQADCDYMEYYLGVSPCYVPSVCDYTNFRFSSGGSKNLVLARDTRLSDHIQNITNGNWISLRDHLGLNYKWQDFRDVKEVFVVPYNISTMTLFEMATAGIPVAIPSRSFIHELRKKYSGVLSELSFLQVNNENVGASHANTPNDYTSTDFYDWWLDRSDFYNLSLMPNIRLVSSFDELGQPSRRDAFDDQMLYDEMINTRNTGLITQRDNLIKTFINSL
jgi:hypothetical protein